jgi:hypothetical protein
MCFSQLILPLLIIILPLLYALYKLFFRYIPLHFNGTYHSLPTLPSLPGKKSTTYYLLLGDAVTIGETEKTSFHEFFYSSSLQIGDCQNYRWWLFYYPFVVLCHPHDIYSTLGSRDQSPYVHKSWTYRNNFDWWFTDSILITEDQQWLKQR